MLTENKISSKFTFKTRTQNTTIQESHWSLQSIKSTWGTEVKEWIAENRRNSCKPKSLRRYNRYTLGKCGPALIPFTTLCACLDIKVQFFSETFTVKSSLAEIWKDVFNILSYDYYIYILRERTIISFTSLVVLHYWYVLQDVQ